MSRFTELNYAVSFTTPAFLGNAEQQAQWRTPPFKALLREWWRILQARHHGYEYARLLDAENKLFGHAGDTGDGGSGQSKVRLRLSSWDKGTQTDTHEQLKGYKVPNGKFPVSAGVYLGYGPIQLQSSRTAIAAHASGPSISFNVILDNCDSEETLSIQRAIQLAHWFGSLGSRARNGWGSVCLEEEGIPSKQPSAADVSEVTRNWKECLRLDWPHAIGFDDTGVLIWQTPIRADWKEVIKDLASIRQTINTLSFDDDGIPSGRHLLSYPVTKSEVREWGNGQRMPNQLRFKVFRAANQYQGRIVHIPSRIPDMLLDKLKLSEDAVVNQEIGVWNQVHRKLDSLATSSTLHVLRIG